MTAACAGGRVQERCRLGFPAKVSCSTPLAQCVALCGVAGGQQEATERNRNRCAEEWLACLLAAADRGGGSGRLESAGGCLETRRGWRRR
jgi:hypothetical protein